jgi:hypothetical protein
MHQGWTKFTSHLWYTTERDGLAALTYSPNELRTTVGNTAVTIKEVTNYPFDDEINFQFELAKAISIPLQLRIPSWCQEASVVLNGKVYRTYAGGQVITLERTWQDHDRLTLKLPMEVRTTVWGKNSRSVERGPLVFALRLEERWEKGNEPREGDYLSVYPKQDWNFGILEQVIKDPRSLRVVENPVDDTFVWNLEHAPIEITVPARKIPGWKAVGGVAHQPVTDRTGVYKGEVGAQVENIRLIPYGCSKVRIVAFPVVK